MAIKTIYIEGVPGLDYVQDDRLKNVDVMLVMREGKMWVKVASGATGRQFEHNAVAGKVQYPAEFPMGEIYGEFDYEAFGEMNIVKYKE